MKVYLKAPSHLSRAMFRVEKALEFYSPRGVEIVTDPGEADLRILHVIGADALELKLEQSYAVIQYCMKTAGGEFPDWQRFWKDAKMVWSYFPHLGNLMPQGSVFYCAPLGLDNIFREFQPQHSRDIACVTSGYVSGPPAEAIEEVALAAHAVGERVLHVGHSINNLEKRYPQTWRYLLNITDEQLSLVYGRARWVSGLRYVEGFELPAAEGLACGARPILFDRSDMRMWYDDHAVFVPEVSGQDLVDVLTEILDMIPPPVSLDEREHVLRKFDWERISVKFWEILVNAYDGVYA